VLETALKGTVATEGAANMGYAAKSAAGETFVTVAAKVPADADVVVFFGGAADQDIATLSLAKAATDAYAAVQKQAPDAKIVVIGPAITGGVDDATLTTLRTTLKNSAAIAKATWVDPIDEKWLGASAQASSSATDLTVANEKTLATKVQAAVEKALK
jgi:acyl-CoA thioesterase I